MEANPGGLAGDFKSYFDSLSKDELKVQFCLPNAYTQFLTLPWQTMVDLSSSHMF
jgi:hypothetical protein